MIGETWEALSQWGMLDTRIALTAALAAMACALPGNYLVLRRQSLMGDALSHAVLPGIAAAFLFVHWAREAGWVTADEYGSLWHAAVFSGAVATGIATALLTELVRKLGGVESTAALGVVFTSLFAAGLILIRLAADKVHLDPECVLYGTIETSVLDSVDVPLLSAIGLGQVPRAAIVNAGMLAVNLFLVVLFFKELRIAAFDPALATTQGINAGAMHYALLAVTAATLVAAFESVGSILVIAMLIVPAATAHLLTDRLGWMIAVSLALAAASAVVGHAAAIALPAPLFSRLGFDTIEDVSTAGMMAVAAGGLFVMALVFGPEYGLASRFVRLTVLRLRVASEDVLGFLYRHEEQGAATAEAHLLPPRRGWARWLRYVAVFRLQRDGLVAATPAGYQLTDAGRTEAQGLVRTHRLWELYLERHLGLPAARLHKSAHVMEHFIGPELREELANELESPNLDPHGRTIPPAG